jgi:hypothetical protein
VLRYLAIRYYRCQVPTHTDTCPQTCPHNYRQTKLSPPNFCIWLIIQRFYLSNKRLELILVVLNSYPQFYPQSALVSNCYPPWKYSCGYPHPRRGLSIVGGVLICILSDLVFAWKVLSLTDVAASAFKIMTLKEWRITLRPLTWIQTCRLTQTKSAFNKNLIYNFHIHRILSILRPWKGMYVARQQFFSGLCNYPWFWIFTVFSFLFPLYQELQHVMSKKHV